MELKELFHKRNQEVIYDSDEGRRIMELIKETQPIEEFTSKHCDTGYFKNYIYKITGGLVILSKWVPDYGYSWEETIVTFIPIPFEEGGVNDD